MRIAVCDDEAAEIEHICSLLENICQRQHIDLELHRFQDCKKFLAFAARSPIDIVFLDIYMDDANGIDTAHILRRFNTTCALVFITSSPDFALDAFEVNACHYLIKPPTEDKLLTALQRAQLLQQEEKTLSLISNYLPLEIPLRTILYMDVQQKNTRIHLQNGSITCTRMPLSQILSELAGEPRFIACHRSVVVNADAIVYFGNDVIQLTNDETLTVSQRRYADAMSSYRRYLFDKVRHAKTGKKEFHAG